MFKVFRHCSFDVLKGHGPLKYSTKKCVIETANRLFARLFAYDTQSPSLQQDELEIAIHSDDDATVIANDEQDDKLHLSSFVQNETVPEKKQRFNDFQLSVVNGKLPDNV